MAFLAIQPARFGVGGIPSVNAEPMVAVPTFLRGYPVVATAGLIDECGANPVLILGFALQDFQTNPGYSMANAPTVITGRNSTASIAIANDSTEFSGPLVNGNNTIIAPVAADLGASYGFTKYTNVWYIDKSKTAANARAIITEIDTFNNIVLFKILHANQQYGQ